MLCIYFMLTVRKSESAIVDCLKIENTMVHVGTGMTQSKHIGADTIMCSGY